MHEQISFAIDASGSAHYVVLSDAISAFLSVKEAGALIDDWPGDFPKNQESGFYSAHLNVSGTLEHPKLHWSKIEKMVVYPSWAKVTEVASPLEKRKRSRTAPLLGERSLAVRIRKKGA